MLVRNWRIRIEDMLGVIEKIDRYTKSLSHSNFNEDEKTIDADILWETTQHDLPPLASMLQRVLENQTE